MLLSALMPVFDRDCLAEQAPAVVLAVALYFQADLCLHNYLLSLKRHDVTHDLGRLLLFRKYYD